MCVAAIAQLPPGGQCSATENWQINQVYIYLLDATVRMAAVRVSRQFLPLVVCEHCTGPCIYSEKTEEKQIHRANNSYINHL